MKTQTVYLSDNWKQFDKKEECIEYEKHVKKIEKQLKKIEKNVITLCKDWTIKEVLKVFSKDKEFKWVESTWYCYWTFMRAISDCSDWYDKPYIKIYNFLTSNN